MANQEKTAPKVQYIVQDELRGVRQEMADVKDAIIREVRDAAAGVKGSVDGLGGRIDAKADSYLAKIALSPNSGWIMAGIIAASALVGFILGRL